MNAPRTHRSAWSAGRDEMFFHIVHGLYPAAFLKAASFLLASYDDTAADDAGDVSVTVPVSVSSSRP